MAKKTSKKLNIGERFTLLALLSNPGDFATYKILQKLKMTLAPNEQENEEYKFVGHFRCPQKKYDDDGKAFQCEYDEYSETAPKCPIHDVYCEPTGMTRWAAEVAAKEKQIWLGNKGLSLVVELLKKLNDEKKLDTDMAISLYAKFVESEKEDEED